MGVTTRTFLGCLSVPGVGPGGISFGGEDVEPIVPPPTVGIGGVGYGGDVSYSPPTVGFGGLAFGGEIEPPIVFIGTGGVAFGGDVEPPVVYIEAGGLALGGVAVEPPAPAVGTGGLGVSAEGVNPPVVYVGNGGLGSGGGVQYSGVVNCAATTTGTASAKMSATFSGLTNGSCSDCNNLNGKTYVMDYIGVCTWEAFPADTICGSAIHIDFIYDGINLSTFEMQTLSPPALVFRYRDIVVWNGSTPITLSIKTADGGQCTGFPSSITLTPA